MKFIKRLYFSYKAWSLYRKSELYMSCDWFEDSLKASQKAMLYEERKNRL